MRQNDKLDRLTAEELANLNKAAKAVAYHYGHKGGVGGWIYDTTQPPLPGQSGYALGYPIMQGWIAYRDFLFHRGIIKPSKHLIHIDWNRANQHFKNSYLFGRGL